MDDCLDDRPVSLWGRAYLVLYLVILSPVFLATICVALPPRVDCAVRSILKKIKPGVSPKTHGIVAASIWSIVGISLMIRGGFFLLSVNSLWLCTVAILIGTGKSFLMLDKSARKNSIRINSMKNGTCIGGIYSLKMWIVVLCMVFLGRALRMSSVPREIVGVVYVAIGWGLFFSSRLLWKNVSYIKY